MRDLGLSLRIKYKLEEIPTEAQALEWARQVENLIKEGLGPDEAGRVAARYLFTINENLILKAEADTIEALLQRAKEK
jgi:hypothetical protein